MSKYLDFQQRPHQLHSRGLHQGILCRKVKLWQNIMIRAAGEQQHGCSVGGAGGNCSQTLSFLGWFLVWFAPLNITLYWYFTPAAMKLLREAWELPERTSGVWGSSGQNGSTGHIFLHPFSDKEGYWKEQETQCHKYMAEAGSIAGILVGFFFDHEVVYSAPDPMADDVSHLSQRDEMDHSPGAVRARGKGFKLGMKE